MTLSCFLSLRWEDFVDSLKWNVVKMNTDLGFLMEVKSELTAASWGRGAEKQPWGASGEGDVTYAGIAFIFPRLSQTHISFRVGFWNSKLYFSPKTKIFEKVFKENLENIKRRKDCFSWKKWKPTQSSLSRNEEFIALCKRNLLKSWGETGFKLALALLFPLLNAKPHCPAPHRRSQGTTLIGCLGPYGLPSPGLCGP